MSSQLAQALQLINKYMSRKVGVKFTYIRGMEKFAGGDTGFGVRFVSAKKGYSFRLNFKSSQAGQNNVSSVDVWRGYSKKGTRLDFEGAVSLAQILPLIYKTIIGKTRKGITRVSPAMSGGVTDMNEDIEDNGVTYITESAKSDSLLAPEKIYDQIVKMLTSGKFVKGHVWKRFKSAGFKIFEAMEERHGDLIFKVGSRYQIEGEGDGYSELKSRLAEDKEALLDAVGATKVRVTKSPKTVIKNDAVTDNLEKNRERLTFEVQLQDMERLLRMLLRGSSNAMFVAGRGGIGKTFTVEKILAEAGLRDGAGYFKNTGSVSTAGMYSLFFKHREGIILFDDSDDALKDQSSRNILKAATDTKKVRKLVWNKMGANVADPDEMTYDEIESAGLIPRHFEFTGKVIFISNLSMDKLDPDGALRTRAFIVDIDPTDQEIYDFMRKIVDGIPLEEGLTLSHADRLEVIQWLEDGTSKQSANLRKLVRGLNMLAGAIADGLSIDKKEMTRMISTYA